MNMSSYSLSFDANDKVSIKLYFVVLSSLEFKVCYNFLHELCYPSVDCIMDMSLYFLSFDVNDKANIIWYFVVLSSLDFKVYYYFLSELCYPLVDCIMDMSRYSLVWCQWQSEQHMLLCCLIFIRVLKYVTIISVSFVIH